MNEAKHDGGDVVDMRLVREAYVLSARDPKEIAVEFGLSPAALVRVARDEGWNDERAMVIEQLAARARLEFVDELSDIARVEITRGIRRYGSLQAKILERLEDFYSKDHFTEKSTEKEFEESKVIRTVDPREKFTLDMLDRCMRYLAPLSGIGSAPESPGLGPRSDGQADDLVIDIS